MPTVLQTLTESGLDPHWLELELTETSLIQNAGCVVDTLKQLREVGITIAIDDFGTGYSSLGYLKNLPVDVIKLDRSFVTGTTTDPDDAALVMTIMTLAHNLRLSVTAEGVETEDQLEFLKLLKCERAQGYLFGKPAPAVLMERLIEKDLGDGENVTAGLPEPGNFVRQAPTPKLIARKAVART